MSNDALLDLAVSAARSAGELLLDRFGGPQSGGDAKSSGDDTLSGKVVSRIFQGNHWLYRVETPAGVVTVIRQNDGEPGPEEGDEVGLAW